MDKLKTRVKNKIINASLYRCDKAKFSNVASNRLILNKTISLILIFLYSNFTIKLQNFTQKVVGVRFNVIVYYAQ